MAYPVVESTWAQRARDPSNPLWLRVYAVAEENHNQPGHTRLVDGYRELKRCLGDETLTDSQISKAVTKGIEMGWLHSASTSRCLLLTWATRDHDCDAHRTRDKRT